MIITRTPLRVSFLGGGTDYPEHFRQHGGATLGTSIDKYIYIMITPLTEFFDHKIRISYSKTELCRELDEVQHPSARECMRFLKIDGGIEISIVSDLPARTGLGSSCAFTVGLLHALHAHKGELISREKLAAESVYVERELLKERVGLQDQYTCACGGFLNLDYSGDNNVSITPTVITADRRRTLQERLLIFYTGQQRSAQEVLTQQMNRTTDGVLTPFLQQLHKLVGEATGVLTDGRPLAEFGELLHHGWELKRHFSDAVSNSLIDSAYARARAAGAIGGKLLGAGGGGFLLLYAEPNRQPAVRKALADLREVPFHFEREGSRILFYQA